MGFDTYAIIGGLALAALLGGWALSERDRAQDAEAALAAALAYIEQTGEVDDALANIPSDDAAVLDRLCIAAGREPGCRDTGPGAAGGDGAR